MSKLLDADFILTVSEDDGTWTVYLHGCAGTGDTALEACSNLCAANWKKTSMGGILLQVWALARFKFEHEHVGLNWEAAWIMLGEDQRRTAYGMVMRLHFILNGALKLGDWSTPE